MLTVAGRFVLSAATLRARAGKIGFRSGVLSCSWRCLTLCWFASVPLSAAGERVSHAIGGDYGDEGGFVHLCTCVIVCCIRTTQLFPFDDRAQVIDAISASLCEKHPSLCRGRTHRPGSPRAQRSKRKKLSTASHTLHHILHNWRGGDESRCVPCTCVCVCVVCEEGGMQTEKLWNIWIPAIALLARLPSQINQTWWGDCQVCWCVCDLY